MATKLKEVDAVIVGLGWTGGILAKELTEAGLKVVALERVVDPAEVYERDIHWINACDAMIAEVSTPSHGVGYELAYALGLGKPVLVCYRDGATVSKMITGNDHDNLVQLAYQGDRELIEAIDSFLADLGSE